MSSEKIIFINPPIIGVTGINRGTVYPPLGLVYIATLLKQNSFPSSIIDANILRMDPRAIAREVVSQDPWLVGITANITTYKSALAVARSLKAFLPDLLIVLGGPHPSSIPRETLNEPCVDMVVVGEGELTVLELVRALKEKDSAEGVSGVAFRQQGEFVLNPSRPLIENLDELPIPDMSFLPSLARYKMRSRAKPVGPLLTSRGCNHSCIYCYKKIFGLKFRPRSPAHVMKEIDYLVKEMRVRQIDVLDDYFNRDLPRAKQILRQIIERYGNQIKINFQNGLRADNVDEEFIDLMKQAGVFKADYGVESADSAVMRHIHKALELEKVVSAVRATQKKGIAVHCNFMFGLPEDNPESMQRTIDFAKKVGPDIASFTIAIPFPGTSLYEEVKAHGRMLIETAGGVDYGFYGNHVYYEIGQTKAADVRRFYQKACLEFYGRPSQVWQIIRNIRSFHELRWMAEGLVNALKNLAA